MTIAPEVFRLIQLIWFLNIEGINFVLKSSSDDDPTIEMMLTRLEEAVNIFYER